jgi:hypothetical protein
MLLEEFAINTYLDLLVKELSRINALQLFGFGTSNKWL